MELKDEILNGESKTLEFKIETPKGKQISKTVIAFANGAGGKLLIGVDDTRKIIGIPDDVDIFNELDNLNSMIYDNCHPNISTDIYTENIDGKIIIVIEVFPGKLKPYYLKKEGRERGVYIRVGASNRRAELENIMELERQRENISYDEEVDFSLEYSNLNLKILEEKFKNKGKKLTAEKLINLKAVQKIGNDLKVTRGLGIILGLYENTEIKCARFKGTDMSYFIDKKEFNSDLFTNLEGIEKFIKNHLNLSSKFSGFQRDDDLEIPILALREGILNALVHRDYTNQGRDIKIGIYDDILEIISPGNLPNTLTIDQIYSGRSEIRNRVLARFFKELDFIEKWGSGINRIKKLCSEKGLKEPSIKETGDSISLIFYRKLNESDGLATDSDGLATDYDGLATDYDKVLEYLKRSKKITTKDVKSLLNIKDTRAKEILKTLIDKKLIVRVGKGRGTHYVLF